MMHRPLAPSLVFVLVLSPGLGGCGSGAPTIPDELLACGGQSNEDDYPPGPYGAEVGDTVENFRFRGYAQPAASRELSNVSFADFFDRDGSSGVRLLLLNTAAAWCQPCQIEHLDLPRRVEELGPRGLRVLSMLFQDSDGRPAAESTLESWVTTFDTNFPMLLDPAYQMGRYGPADTPPLNLVVDPRDMSILRIFVGNQEGPMWSFVEEELDRRNASR